MHKRDVFPCLVGLAVLAACDPDIHEPGTDAGDAAPRPEPSDDPDLLLSHDPDPNPESAYDGNLWLDACQSQEPDLQRLLDANAMLVPTGSLQANGNDTFKIITTAFTDYAGKPLVPESLFYGQRRVGAGRTGVLVGPDVVVTAPHVTNFNFAGFRVVFGLAARMVNGTCVQPDWDHVPAEDIYVPVEMIVNTYTGGIDPHDFAFLRLDRDTDREPLRIRRSGKARDGDNLVGVGHPMRLSAKLSPEGEALGWDDAKGLLMNGLHFLDGSSGSMIYNRDADYLETVVRTGICGQFQSLPGNTYQLVPLCPAAPRAVNRPIADIADVVPATSLVVTPLDEVEHRASRNATPSNTTTLYKLRAPPGQPPTQWQIVMPPAPANQPKLTLSPRSPRACWPPGAPSRSARRPPPPASAGTTSGPSRSTT
ncbi:trypsin-like peptidase domain-containing protein [Nannocystis pusilla]|uniref:trypsin-like serine peptidase n=1 Tax=Nannocystis pusilla TaxID=889268 RepID=UPI003B7AD974